MMDVFSVLLLVLPVEVENEYPEVSEKEPSYRDEEFESPPWNKPCRCRLREDDDEVVG